MTYMNKASVISKEQCRIIAVEIVAGRGSYTPFVRAWAELVAMSTVSQMDMIYDACKNIIDYYHLEGYTRPLGAKD